MVQTDSRTPREPSTMGQYPVGPQGQLWSRHPLESDDWRGTPDALSLEGEGASGPGGSFYPCNGDSGAFRSVGTGHLDEAFGGSRQLARDPAVPAGTLAPTRELGHDHGGRPKGWATSTAVAGQPKASQSTGIGPGRTLWQPTRRGVAVGSG